MTAITSNNYNNCSKHIDIEVTCFLDALQAQTNFDENFQRIEPGLLLFTNGSSDTTQDDPLEPVKINAVDRDEFAAAVGKTLGIEFDESDSVEDILNELDLNLFDVHNDTGSVPILDDLGVEIEYTTPFTLISRGYSQGDCHRVVVPANIVEEFEEKYEGDLDSKLQSLINDLLWNTPIYCYIEVEGVGYYIDIDEWDKEDAVKNLAEQYTGPEKEYLLEQVRKMLPEYPEYA